MGLQTISSALFELLLRNAEAASQRHRALRRVLEARPRLNRRNGLLRARRNIAYHYDLGNELFELMLDETMTYSCAVFDKPELTLAEAQRAKLDRICAHLQLGSDDHVLEIGCGWGGFAIRAAQQTGCRVTGLTISAEQAKLARERVAAAGLSDRITILEQDYREHDGRYSKVASIEMLEAIGDRQFGTFFATIDRVLEPRGIACVQTILIPDDRWERYRKTPDWIERYVFPGCLIPSLTSLAVAATRSSRLLLHEVDEIGPHYAETLRRWRANVHERIDEVRALGYDSTFERTWDFYLAFCEAGFPDARAARRSADADAPAERLRRGLTERPETRPFARLVESACARLAVRRARAAVEEEQAAPACDLRCGREPGDRVRSLARRAQQR